jgi:carbon-monoxide dehydrogenase iron sulfur subunit
MLSLLVYRKTKLSSNTRVKHIYFRGELSEQLGRLVIDAKKCTGCKLCEEACSFAHEKVFDPRRARLWVVKVEPQGLDYPVVCRECGKAPCIDACPVDALYQDGNSNLVRLNSEVCILCGACVDACPFGAMSLHPKTGLPLVCDLCNGDPACVKKCPTGAINYITMERAVQVKARRNVETMSRSLLKSWGVK